VSALFTSYALQGKPVENWGCDMLIDLERALQYVKSSGVSVKENIDAWSSFTDRWVYYLNIRKISTKNNQPVFPDKFDAKERELFYKSITGGSWPGSNGYDSVIIAYDALLGCKGSWKEVCLRAVLHGGDNDSTGCIAASWFGAMYGFNGVPHQNYKVILLII
jgi:ADP-ribosylarginine hydrolase